MARYLISFDDGSMDYIRDEDLPEVSKATHAVMREAVHAGVFVIGGGVDRQRASIAATDGTVTDGPYPETKAVLGGFVVIEVAEREEALRWAAKFASACRCAQEVREIMSDPQLDAMLAVSAGDPLNAR